MIELNAETFHAAMAQHGDFVCILYRGTFEDEGGQVQGLREAAGKPWIWARIDVAAAEEIAEMFRVDDDRPRLLVVRSKVVLYCAPVAAATHTVNNEILTRAACLDMSRVQREIEQERAGKAAVAARRACPTTWRQR